MKKIILFLLILSVSIAPVSAEAETKIVISYPPGGVDRKCTWTQRSIVEDTQEALEKEGFSTEVL
ncbi:hypothetical protein ACG74X_20510 [Marivita sp. S0852]